MFNSIGFLTNMWSQVGSFLAGLMFIHAMFWKHFPDSLKQILSKHTNKLMSFLSPNVFAEYPINSFRRSQAYSAIQSYLSASPSALSARRPMARAPRPSLSPWTSTKRSPISSAAPRFGGPPTTSRLSATTAALRGGSTSSFSTRATATLSRSTT